jgi:hypothetical protein
MWKLTVLTLVRHVLHFTNNICCLVLLLVYFVNKTANVDGVGKSFGTAADGNCGNVSIDGLLCVSIGRVNLGFDLRATTTWVVSGLGS